MISKVSSNSLRESYQHTDNPFDIFGLLIDNFTISNGLSVCWYDSLNELELTLLITG